MGNTGVKSPCLSNVGITLSARLPLFLRLAVNTGELFDCPTLTSELVKVCLAIDMERYGPSSARMRAKNQCFAVDREKSVKIG